MNDATFDGLFVNVCAKRYTTSELKWKFICLLGKNANVHIIWSRLRVITSA